MKKILIFKVVLFSFAFLPVLFAHASGSHDCVILLHGMGRTQNAMKKIEKELIKAGYIVWNETYPSTKKPIEELSVSHIDKGISYCNRCNSKQIHFVTHSLGGILVRYFLQDHTLDNLGKIVMLSPPNKGSEVADYLKDLGLYEIMMGPAGQQLGTNADSIPKKMKPVHATIGVITGEKGSESWFSPMIPGKDDGKVSVESAKLDEMSDFLIVKSGHTFIMRDNSVIDQIKYFLKNGKFERKNPLNSSCLSH